MLSVPSSAEGRGAGEGSALAPGEGYAAFGAEGSFATTRPPPLVYYSTATSADMAELAEGPCHLAGAFDVRG